MNCIVIDDENISRILLEKYIKKTESLNLLASFDSAVDAINAIEQIKNINLIFLDIEMPDMTGIEFLESREVLPQIIIVSAREEYALNAIEYEVTDYLVKPISYARFYKAVLKAKKKLEINQNNNTHSGIFIKEAGNNFKKIQYNDILWIEALENYIAIFTNNEKYTLYFTMKSIENQLPKDMFCRIHRSYIVNINKIDAIEDYNAIISKNEENINIPISKKNFDDLLTKINYLSK